MLNPTLFFLLLFMPFSMSVFHARFKTSASDELKSATLFAFSLMDTWFNTTCDINVDMYIEDFHSSTEYAHGTFLYMCDHPLNNPYTLIPAALYTLISGCNYCRLDSNTSHMSIHINNNNRLLPFYFQTEQNVPLDHVDFVTLLLHESMHGLGFASGFTSNNGFYAFYPSFYLFDTFIFNIEPRLQTIYPLSNAAMLTSDSLTFNYSNESFPIYAPRIFSSSSISHTNRVDSLIYYKASIGKAMHCLTPDCLLFFQAMGYPLKNDITDRLCVSSSASFVEWFFDFY